MCWMGENHTPTHHRVMYHFALLDACGGKSRLGLVHLIRVIVWDAKKRYINTFKVIYVHDMHIFMGINMHPTNIMSSYITNEWMVLHLTHIN